MFAREKLMGYKQEGISNAKSYGQNLREKENKFKVFLIIYKK